MITSRRKLVKRSFMIVVITIATTLGIFAHDQEPTQPIRQVSDSYVEHVQKQTNLAAHSEETETSNPGILPEDTVRFIVELKEAPLMELKDETESMTEFLKSRKAINQKKSIEAEQSKWVDQAKNKIGKKSLEVIETYDAAFNGLSIELQYRHFETLKKLEGTAAVYLENEYEYVKPEMHTSNEFTNANRVHDRFGYTGEGVVVAVFDSGLDTEHEAFQIAPKNPKHNVLSMKHKLESLDLQAKKHTPTLSTDTTYLNEKVPYAYDYADKDSNVNSDKVSVTNHGTHVAGIVGGHSASFEGTAPDTQLMIFKIFPDRFLSASDTTLIAALDDAIKLDVDVINMSLGTPGGFTNDHEAFNTIIERVVENGTIINISAGNSDNAANRNQWGTNASHVSVPDDGIVSRPSTIDKAMSIASFDTHSQWPSFLHGFNRDFKFLTLGDFEPFKDIEIPYVVVPNSASAHDYQAIARQETLEDRFHVIKIDPQNVKEQLRLAQQYKAKAVFFYDNIANRQLQMLSSHEAVLPVGFLTHEDGLFLNAQVQSERKLLVDSTQYNEKIDKERLMFSSFSSIGSTSDLRIKPELAGIGGSVRSSLPRLTGHTYGEMSGTSMSSPNVAGASALILQHLNQTEALSGSERVERVNKLLMSTARRVNYEGVPLPVRRQGAGLIDVEAALKTNSFLSVEKTFDGTSRPKIELGDDVSKTGKYSFSFQITNTSDEAQTYSVTQAMTVPRIFDKDISGKTEQFIGNANRFIEGELQGDKVVSVNAKSTKTLNYTFVMSEAEKETLNKQFVNGNMVEGYIILTPQNNANNGIDLSIPVLAFYGDWEQGAVLEPGKWYEPNTQVHNYQTAMKTGKDIYLGSNSIDPAFIQTNPNMFTISPNNDGYHDKITESNISLLRNAKKVELKVSDQETGKVYLERNKENVRKSNFEPSSTQFHPSIRNFLREWDGFGDDRSQMPEGRYVYSIKADIGYREGIDEELNIPIIIDITKPTLDESTITYQMDGDAFKMKFNVVDENYIINSMVAPVEGNKASWDKPIHKQYSPSEGLNKHEIEIDATQYMGKTIALSILDSGMNENVYYMDVPIDETGKKALDKDFVTIPLGESYPIKFENQITGEAIRWVSSDTSILTVDQRGVVEPLKAGQATVTLRNERGESQELVVGIYETPKLKGFNLGTKAIKVESYGRGRIKILDVYDTGAKWNPQKVKWSSSNEFYLSILSSTGDSVEFTTNHIVNEKASIFMEYEDIKHEIVVDIIPTAAHRKDAEFEATHEIQIGETKSFDLTETLLLSSPNSGAQSKASEKENKEAKPETVEKNKDESISNKNEKTDDKEQNSHELTTVDADKGKEKQSDIQSQTTDYRNTHIEWINHNQDIAKIETQNNSELKVVGLKPGIAVIEEKTKHGSRYYNILVNASETYPKFEFEAKTYDLKVGERVDLSEDFASIKSGLHEYNKDIVAFDQNGFTGLKPGSTIVEFVLKDGRRRNALINVEVVENSELRNIINMMKQFQNEGVIESSGNRLRQEIKLAEGLIRDPEANQARIQATIDRLRNIEEELRFKFPGSEETITIDEWSIFTIPVGNKNGTWTYEESAFELIEDFAQENVNYRKFKAINDGKYDIVYKIGKKTYQLEVKSNDKAKPVEPTPGEPTPVDPTPVDPTPVDPTPVDPTPVDPTPVDPTPVDPTPVDPTPVDPTPVDPTPVDPTPVDPTPVDPTPVDPTPVDPTPVDPTPVDPTPVDPTPVDPTPVEPTPVDPTPVEPTPGEGNEIYPEPIGPKKPDTDNNGEGSKEIPTNDTNNPETGNNGENKDTEDIAGQKPGTDTSDEIEQELNKEIETKGHNETQADENDEQTLAKDIQDFVTLPFTGKGNTLLPAAMGFIAIGIIFIAIRRYRNR